MLRLDFNAIPIFCLHRALHKIHTWKLFAYRIFAHGKIKSGRKSLVKRKKYRPKEEKKSTILARKEKNPPWKRLAVAELHAGVQISNKEVAVKTKFAIHNVKNEVSFSFCMPCYKNMNNRLECNFESCRSICCLAPQHIFRFFHFCREFFPLPLATLLIIVSSSSTLHWTIEIKKKTTTKNQKQKNKKKTCLQRSTCVRQSPCQSHKWTLNTGAALVHSI